MIRCQVLMVTLLASVGCQSIRGTRSPEFIKPLAAKQDGSEVLYATPKNERELCIRTAAIVASSGHVTEAIKLYENAEQLDSNAAPLDRELAPLYAQAGDAEKSITRYQRAIRYLPNDAELQNNFAWTLLELNRPGQAIQVIETALQKFPENRRLQSTRAIASYHAGDRQDAIRRFTSLYGSSAAYHNVALLDVETGDPEHAQSSIAKAMESNPTAQTIQLASAIDQHPVKQSRQNGSDRLDLPPRQ